MTSRVAAALFIAFKGVDGEGFLFENGLLIELSVLLGTIVGFFPGRVMNSVHIFLRPILGNGFVVRVVVALILEHVVVSQGSGSKQDKPKERGTAMKT